MYKYIPQLVHAGSAVMQCGLDRASIISLNSVFYPCVVIWYPKQQISRDSKLKDHPVGKVAQNIQLESLLAKETHAFLSVCRLLLCAGAELSLHYESVPFKKTKHMPENQYRETEDKGTSVAKPMSYTGWRTTGGTHPLAPHLFSINETWRNRVNSGSCSGY